jgi:hypothetical protein
MNDSKHYRSNAAGCLKAAYDACQPGRRGLHLSMAISWLSLARRDQAMDDLLASWEAGKPIENDCVLGLVTKPFVSENRP